MWLLGQLQPLGVVRWGTKLLPLKRRAMCFIDEKDYVNARQRVLCSSIVYCVLILDMEQPKFRFKHSYLEVFVAQRFITGID